MLILGIETSCDETGAAVFDTTIQQMRSSALYSQIDLHRVYGGVVPEIAARSQLDKIDIIIQHALDQAGVSLDIIDAIAVTNKPGLVGSLLTGVCFAKGMAYARNKKIIGVDHLEGHMFSAFLRADGSVNHDIKFPFITFSASGGHTAIYLVHDFGRYEVIGWTLDDAAGEAFDKIAKVLGLGYPGGATIERLAGTVNFEDFYHYPRTKPNPAGITFSFSGLKTAVLYDLVKKGAYVMATGPVAAALTPELLAQVSSSLLVCMGDIFCDNIKRALKQYPDVTGVTFVGGVACNKYLRSRLQTICERQHKSFVAAPPAYCTDNGAMIAFVGGYMAERGQFADLTLDVMK